MSNTWLFFPSAGETVKDLGGKAVESVKGLFGKAKEKADSPSPASKKQSKERKK